MTEVTPLQNFEKPSFPCSEQLQERQGELHISTRQHFFKNLFPQQKEETYGYIFPLTVNQLIDRNFKSVDGYLYGRDINRKWVNSSIVQNNVDGNIQDILQTTFETIYE